MAKNPRRNVFELDVTWRCNLTCANCTRRCDILSSDKSEDMDPAFFEDQLKIDHDWHRIFVMGGEPTLHPRLMEFIEIFQRYRRDKNPKCEMTVVSNAHGSMVNRVLDSIPDDIFIRRADKFDSECREGTQLKQFWTSNIAPVDFACFKDEPLDTFCGQQKRCGLQLTINGWYHCSMIGGIDRVFGIGGDTLAGTLANPRWEDFCGLCGRMRMAYVPQHGNSQDFHLPDDKMKQLSKSIVKWPLKSDQRYLSKSYRERLKKCVNKTL